MCTRAHAHTQADAARAGPAAAPAALQVEVVHALADVLRQHGALAADSALEGGHLKGAGREGVGWGLVRNWGYVINWHAGGGAWERGREGQAIPDAEKAYGQNSVQRSAAYMLESSSSPQHSHK